MLYSLSAVVVISLISLIGIFALSTRESTLHRLLFVFLSFSAGSILGAAYLDLLPEAIEHLGEENLSLTMIYIIIGFLGFFFLERFIYWFHGHIHGSELPSEVDKRASVKNFVYLNLVGDGIHNFIDGMIISAAFLVNLSVGMATTVAVILHELPQEIGDFGILVYGGITRYKALFFNFLSALMAIGGVLVSNYLSIHSENFIGFLMAIAAGGFIYISASELIPEMQKEEALRKSIIQFFLFFLGIFLVWSLGLLFPE